MSKPTILFNKVSKRYTDSVLAVNDVSFAVEPGTLLALLGPSGCGKTTTLRLLAGLETPDVGEIWLDGRCVAGRDIWLPPEARRVGMVFQDYALFPHLTVEANVAFGLNVLPPKQRRPRVMDMLDLAGIADLATRYSHQLSGGQQQRVALARALAPHPGVVLLDEPFSNLDAALRKVMRDEVRRMLRAVAATAIFVTHDREEALSIADRVAVMHRGTLLQMDSPQAVYLHPRSREVALLVGDANFLPGQADGAHVTCALGKLSLLHPVRGPAEVFIRPERIMLYPDPTDLAQVTAIQFFGHDQLVQVRLADGTCLEVRTLPRADLNPGMSVQVVVQGPVLAYSHPPL